MIVQFPVKKHPELSEEHGEQIEKFAKSYVSLLNEICNEMVEPDDDDKYVAEVFEMILTKLVKSFGEALEDEIGSD